MANSNSTSAVSPKSNKFHTGDLIQNRSYPLTFGVVVRSDWAANGRVPGYVVRCDAAWYRGRALQFIPADLAELLHRDEPVTITAREDVLVAACSSPTDASKTVKIGPRIWQYQDRNTGDYRYCLIKVNGTGLLSFRTSGERDAFIAQWAAEDSRETPNQKPIAEIYAIELKSAKLDSPAMVARMIERQIAGPNSGHLDGKD